MKSTLRLAALALVAAYGISCCGGAKKACNTACGADCACGDSCACTAACAVDSAKLALQVYDPNQPLNLQDMNLFLEYDKTDTIKVSETVTRKFIYLNDLMTVIVDFDNGSPFASCRADQLRGDRRVRRLHRRPSGTAPQVRRYFRRAEQCAAHCEVDDQAIAPGGQLYPDPRGFYQEITPDYGECGGAPLWQEPRRFA